VFDEEWHTNGRDREQKVTNLEAGCTFKKGQSKVEGDSNRIEEGTKTESRRNLKRERGQTKSVCGGVTQMGYRKVLPPKDY